MAGVAALGSLLTMLLMVLLLLPSFIEYMLAESLRRMLDIEFVMLVAGDAPRLTVSVPVMCNKRNKINIALNEPCLEVFSSHLNPSRSRSMLNYCRGRVCRAVAIGREPPSPLRPPIDGAVCARKNRKI